MDKLIISRKAVDNQVKQWGNSAAQDEMIRKSGNYEQSTVYQYGYYDGYMKAKAEVLANATPYEEQWIKTSDRKPTEDDAIDGCVRTLDWNEKLLKWKQIDYDYGLVAHSPERYPYWQPLPALPTELLTDKS